jgi:hypothetical protein
MKVISNAEYDALEQNIRRLEYDRSELRDKLKAADAQFETIQAQLFAAKAPIPTTLLDVTVALKSYVPTITQAPTGYLLDRATDAKSYAQALNMLLLHARSVGYAEGRRDR